ncbi:MAG TPA: hypothetical protein PLN21_14220 [Gemmatales bacterium]|nr:hypothetical protein [Gemmatales bacterium]
MRIIPIMLLFAFTLAIMGCSRPDAEPGKVAVTATKTPGKRDVVSTPRPKK